MKKLFAIILVIVSIATLFAFSGCQGEVIPDPIDDNYRVFYQIFVGSFSDSDGDGVGDLRGIINRMDYLNDGNINDGDSLGVQGIWLTPIFASPSYHKYDVSNYYRIASDFGKEQDLKDLIAICKERNVKLILDLVLNHTSLNHDNFGKFMVAHKNGDTDSPYYDYYNYRNGSVDMIGSNQAYPLSTASGTYYEGNFDSAMPELNYDNELVRKDMLDVAKYYLDLGVDGFRFDAVKYIYYGNTAKTVDFWKWYIGELEKIKSDVYTVGECWSAESEIMQYYDAFNCFNFGISGAESSVATAAKGFSVGNFTNYVTHYQSAVKSANPEGMPIPFLSNHDQDRIGGAFILPSNMKMAANLYLLSPGSPFIYYGEELGMLGSRGGANTDANRRLAMLWGEDDTPRNPEGSTYPNKDQIQDTVADQLQNQESMLNHYCKLIAIRNKHKEIARGDYSAVTSTNSRCGGFLVDYAGDKLVILHNTDMDEVTVDLSQLKGLGNYQIQQLCDYVGSGSAKLDGTMLTFVGQGSVILK